jgi:hypothetical protein
MGDSTSSAQYAATAYEMAGYNSYYSFYPTYAYLSGANPGGSGRLESDVVFLCGHANPTLLLFGDKSGSSDNMCGVYYTNDLDSTGTTGFQYAGLQQSGRNLSGVRLISFIGCDTAGYSGNTASQANNLCTRATDSTRSNGNYADAALGFTDEIRPFGGSGLYWLQKFNDALAFGYSVDDAVDYADVYAEIYRVEHGEDSIADLATCHAVFGDGSTTITPL